MAVTGNASVILTGVEAKGYVAKVLVWGQINDNQTANWQPVADSQTSNWSPVNDGNTVVWTQIPT